MKSLQCLKCVSIVGLITLPILSFSYQKNTLGMNDNVDMVASKVKIFPDIVKISPLENKEVMVENVSSVEALNLKISLTTGLRDVKITNNCEGINLSKFDKCSIYLQSGKHPGGLEMLAVSGKNFDASTGIVIADNV
ncbi:hypothetical protein L3V86_00685 [Thiotrichales bacterium 19S11-10]|nr:hypothetical protein [Thiotrichales bacterium 19S11-10]